MQLNVENDKYNSNEILDKFNDLIHQCYEGSLKSFSNDFSENDQYFYEKLKKEVQRAKIAKLSVKKQDIFKKYIFFLEYKLWEKKSDDKTMKHFDFRIDSVIKGFCKTNG